MHFHNVAWEIVMRVILVSFILRYTKEQLILFNVNCIMGISVSHLWREIWNRASHYLTKVTKQIAVKENNPHHVLDVEHIVHEIGKSLKLSLHVACMYLCTYLCIQHCFPRSDLCLSSVGTHPLHHKKPSECNCSQNMLFFQEREWFSS